MNFKSILFLLLCFTLFTSCEDEEVIASFGIFEVLDDLSVQMNGDIRTSTLGDFENMIDEYPDVDEIYMLEVPGSLDDEINLKLSKKVHDLGFSIHLEDDGIIASGGVDFFLAGTKRTIGENTMIGVHAWTDGVNEATDFPVGDPMHQPYIDYFVSVGMTQQEAEDFYYFTINAAPAASLHYMTADEIEEYNLLTE